MSSRPTCPRCRGTKVVATFNEYEVGRCPECDDDGLLPRGMEMTYLLGDDDPSEAKCRALEKELGAARAEVERLEAKASETWDVAVARARLICADVADPETGFTTYRTLPDLITFALDRIGAERDAALARVKALERLVYELETEADPAGTVRSNVERGDTIQALAVALQEAHAERDALAGQLAVCREALEESRRIMRAHMGSAGPRGYEVGYQRHMKATEALLASTSDAARDWERRIREEERERCAERLAEVARDVATQAAGAEAHGADIETRLHLEAQARTWRHAEGTIRALSQPETPERGEP